MRLDDPVPDDVRSAALSAFARRGGGRRLVPLVWDGDVDPAPGPGRPAGSAGVSADPELVGEDARHLWFLGEGLAVEAWIGRRAPRHVVGVLTPPGAGAVGLETDGSTGRPSAGGAVEVTSVLVGDDGRFSLGLPPRGVVRLSVRRPGRAPSVTGWVLIDAE